MTTKITLPCEPETQAAAGERADRAVLYGAVLAAQRPNVRLKPAIAAPALALVPAVRAFLSGDEEVLAAAALAYARACGAEDFLLAKRAAQHAK
jgi:hypothetical protein